jgi:hypothetical protein
MKKKNRIIPQMFDVRPVKETGDLDLEKIKKVGINKIFKTKSKKIKKEKVSEKRKIEANPNIYDVKIGTDETAIIGYPKKKINLVKRKINCLMAQHI